MNIFVDGDESEVYIPTDEFRQCKIDDYDWHGKDVYIGVDLSQTTDNTAVSMVTYDNDLDKYICKCWAFIPSGNVQTKSKIEKVPYDLYIQKKWVYQCGDKVIDHGFIEDFVTKLPEQYGVNILSICYDRYNCISSANKWESNGIQTIEIKQHSSVLHPATKLLKECVYKRRFQYIQNSFFELNISNAREVLDTNLNGYVNKKKSTGKIDLVAATINAMVMWNIDIENNLKCIYESDNRQEGFIVL